MNQNESKSPNSNSPEQSSTPPETLPEDAKLERLKTLLKDEGVDLDQLVICMLGGAECLVGELGDNVELKNMPQSLKPVLRRILTLKNPKRLMRRQEQRGSVASIIFYIADLDLISGGYMEVSPVAISAIRWLSVDSQISYASVYLIHIEQQKEDRMAKAGLVMAEGPLSHLRPNLR